MKKLFLMLLLLCLLIPTSVHAEGELVFTYEDVGNGYITITGVENFSGGVLNIPAFYDGKTVLHIKDSCFMLMTELTEVVLPETLESVGMYVFSDCPELTKVTLPRSLRTIADFAFSASPLAEVELHEYISYIGINAFKGNNDTMYFVTKGTEGADFVKAQGFPKVEVKEPARPFEITYTVDKDGNATVTGGKYFSVGNITIPLTTPEGHPVVAIADGAFRGYETVTEIKVCENVVSIGKDVFADCPRLESVSIHEAPIKTIGDGAFANCPMLAEMTLPDTVEYIGNKAFSNCILSVTDVPPSVKEMGHYAFDYNPDAVFRVQEGSYAEQFFIDREYRYISIKKDGSEEQVDIARTKRIISAIMAVVIIATELFVAVYTASKNKPVKKVLYKSRHIR